MSDLTERHPAISAGLARLEPNDNLPDRARVLSARFAELGRYLADVLPSDPDIAEALRKLWESQNCAVYVAVRSWDSGIIR